MSHIARQLGTWAPPVGRPVVNLAHLAYFDRGARGRGRHCLILVMVGGHEVVLDHPSTEAQELAERSLRASLSSAADSDKMAAHILRLPRYGDPESPTILIPTRGPQQPHHPARKTR